MIQTIKKQKRPGTDHIYDFYHEGRGLLFQRVVAGIVFPGSEPGFFVVLGEEAVLRGQPKIYWLAEMYMQDLGRFTRTCLDIALEYKVQSIYGNPSDVDLCFISEYNKAASAKQMPTIHVQKAPRVHIPLAFHINLLKEKHQPNTQTVYLSENSYLPGALQGLPTALDKVTEKEFPPPAALAYAVAALVLNPYCGEDNVSYEADGDYDMFNENN